MEQTITTFVINLIAYAGGSSALAYLVFKTLGSKWLDAKFKERLKYIEHGYAIELSRLKQRLDTAASGQNRIHQKEFEVLPEAWGLLDEAMSTLKWVVSPLQSYVNVSNMDDDDWADFVEGFEGFNKADKRHLKGLHASERKREYERFYDGHKNRLAGEAMRNFQQYIARNSIFLPENLRLQFDNIRDVLWSASVAKSVGLEAEDWKLQLEGWKKIDEKAEPLFKSIRESIQERIAKQTELNVEGLNMVKLD